jgi:hypothetical protein
MFNAQLESDMVIDCRKTMHSHYDGNGSAFA